MPSAVKPATYSSHPQTTEQRKSESKYYNKKYVIAGSTGILLLLAGIIKRKAISNLFKNIFSKIKKEPKTIPPEPTKVPTPQTTVSTPQTTVSTPQTTVSTPQTTVSTPQTTVSTPQTAITSQPTTVMPPKPTKTELPKPTFTVSKENTEQYAKEKAEYIKSIWDEFLDVNTPYKPVNKEKNILGLQALQKYGTRDDLLKLSAEYRLSEDSDIMKEYAKLAGIVGSPADIIPLRAKINEKGIKTYTEETISEIMNTLKILMVDKAEQGYFKNANYNSYREFEKLSTHKNNKIAENAKAIMKRLSDENPWMLE